MNTPCLKPRALSGFPDYSPAENTLLGQWVSKVQETYTNYGYDPLFTRPLELREVLLSKGGLSSQIFGVSRLTEDGDPATDKNTDLALPYDRTIPFANWLARQGSQVSFPYRRYDIGYSYRGERAQKGRFQAFLQADIDVVSNTSLDLSTDAEVISTITQALGNLGFSQAEVRFNNLDFFNACLKSLLPDPSALPEVITLADRFPKMTPQEQEDRFTDLLGSNPTLLSFLQFQGSLSTFIEQFAPLCDLEGWAEVAQLADYLGALGVNFAFTPAIVRGLDYYSGTVFETFLPDQPALGSVASGGRYTSLLSAFGRSDVVGFGGSIGLSRLFECVRGAVTVNPTRVLVIVRDETLRLQALQCAAQLRAQGQAVELFPVATSFKKQMAYANRQGYPKVLLVMSSEEVFLKDMVTGEQTLFQ